MRKPIRKVSDKLASVNENFTINMYDNGYMIEVGGRTSGEDYKTAKVLVQTVDELLVEHLEVSWLSVRGAPLGFTQARHRSTKPRDDQSHHHQCELRLLLEPFLELLVVQRQEAALLQRRGGCASCRLPYRSHFPEYFAGSNKADHLASDAEADVTTQNEVHLGSLEETSALFVLGENDLSLRGLLGLPRRTEEFHRHGGVIDGTTAGRAGLFQDVLRSRGRYCAKTLRKQVRIV